jgi:two-component system, CitB family, sensor kinase
VELGLVDGEVDVVVRDSGAGVPPGMEREVFRRGMSTKEAVGHASAPGASERGIGLSLVHLVCTRRGGEVSVSTTGGSAFSARLPAEPALAGS